jgi:TolB-like protein/DNA-binding winged helix-turn-helix (wHTH) protein/Flp pilus assembly protein TadD
MQVAVQASRIRFGAFEVDLRSGELRKHGLKVKLQVQPFQILALLLERPGEVVTREELQARLWPADTFVDFDVGLNTAIKRLRDALGDTAESPRYIETLPRRGYRFVAPVEKQDSHPLSTPPNAEQASTNERVTPAPTPTTAHNRARILLIAVLALGATLVAPFGVKVGGLWHRIAGTAPHPIRSIAVLPLENLSHDQDQEYFADGMTEALVTNLGKVGELRVISRTSVMRYKGTKKPLQEIAHELQVDALVEGTVTRSAGRVRITANLVQAWPETHLWADSFERELGDVLALQNDVSRTIANQIQISLTPQERTRLANTRQVDPAAYEAYLEGRYFWWRGEPATWDKAGEYYKLAVAKDPNWALPYSGLAEMYAVAGANAAIPNESCSKAKTTALNAVEKDDTVAETHTTLGEIELWCEWDWAGADRELRRAIDVNPSFARAHSSYSRYLLAMGRINEALAESKRAVELDPLSSRIRWDRWLLFYYTGQYVAAEEQCQKMQEIDPTNSLGPLYCGDVALAKGDFAHAIRELQESVSLSQGGNPRAVAHLGYAYAVVGRTADAQNILAQLKKMPTRQYVHPVLVARVCAGLGQRQEALEWLEAGYRVHSRDLLELKYDPRLASLRSEPRFRDLLRRVGLPQ